MKKILLDAGTGKAADCINRIEQVFIAKVFKLSHSLKRIGIEADKDLLRGIILKDYKPLQAAFDKLVQAETKGLSSNVLKDEVTASLYKGLAEVKSIAATFHLQEVQELPFDLDTLTGIFEITEGGSVIIPDAQKEIIHANYEIWIEQPERIQLYNAHNKAGEALQAYWNALRKVGMESVIPTPKYFVMSTFDFIQHEGPDVEIKVTPLNYNFQKPTEL